MKKHLFFAACLATALFSACSNNEVEQLTSNEGTKVSFAINRDVARATTDANTGITTFAVGEQIGISSTGLTEDLKGTSFTIKDTNGNLEATNGSTFTYNQKNPASFYAYYPVTATATANTSVDFSIQADQSDETKYHSSDFMTAQILNQTPVASTVNLSFAHQLTLIRVLLDGFENDTEVVMKGVIPNVSWTFVGEVTTGNNATIDITMWKRTLSDTSTEYWAVVPAQTLKKDQILFAIKADKNYTYTPSTEVTLEKGKQTKFTLHYTPANKSIALSSTLTSTWGAMTEQGTFEVENKQYIIAPTEIPALTTGRTNLTEAAPWGYYFGTNTSNSTTGAGTVTFDQATSGFTINITTKARWDLNTVFFYGVTNKINTGNKYQLSFDMSSNKSSAQITLGMSKSESNDFYCIEDGTSTKTYYTLRLQTCSATVNEEKSYSLIFNCKYYSNSSGTGAISPSESATEEDKEFYLFFYPNTLNADITIKNIQLVQVD